MLTTAADAFCAAFLKLPTGTAALGVVAGASRSDTTLDMVGARSSHWGLSVATTK
jgi:hypothetical protein